MSESFRGERPEPQEPRPEVASLNERMRKIDATFRELTALESARPFSFEGFMAAYKDPDPNAVDAYAHMAELRADMNRELAALAASAPDGWNAGELRVALGRRPMAELVALAKQNAVYFNKYRAGLPILPGEEPKESYREFAAEYFSGASNSDGQPERVRDRARWLVDEWTFHFGAQAELGISAADEARAPALSENAVDAVRLGRERTFHAIRSSVAAFLNDHRLSAAERPAAVRRLRDRAKELRGALVLGYYESLEDLPGILATGGIKNIFELNEAEQDQKKKSWRSLAEIKLDRSRIEQALGWMPGEPVYHFVVESPADEGENYARDNYGPVRFTFDLEALKDRATFTEGDSLNPTGLPSSIRNKLRSSDKTEGVVARQISAEHVPLAKALFEQATKPEDTAHARTLRYIEAQVGGISGSELFDYLTEVVVHVAEAEASIASRGTDRAQAEERRALDDLKAFCLTRDIPYREL